MAVAQWSSPGKGFETLYKRAVIVKTRILRYPCNAVRGVLDGVDRVEHADLFDKDLGGHFHALAENAHEVAFRKAAQLRQRSDRDRFRVVAEDMLDGGKQAVKFRIKAHDLGVGAVDGDEANHFR